MARSKNITNSGKNAVKKDVRTMPENQNMQKLNPDANDHTKSGPSKAKSFSYKNTENSFNPRTQPGGESGFNQGHGPGNKSKGQHGGNRGKR